MAANESTDMGIGLAALLSAIVLVAAIVTYLSPVGLGAGAGFAAAVIAASFAVAVIHAYGSR